MEAAGLNTVAVFKQGHVFAGVWLQPQRLADLQAFECGQLRKHIGLSELIVFETTLATDGNHAPFSAAIKNATAALAEEREADFRYAIDLRRAREQKITPLDLSDGAAAAGDAPVTEEASAVVGLEPPPSLGRFDEQIDADASPAETPRDRLERWKLRLLDLTKRNRLLNLKENQTAIRLDCPDPGELEDRLAGTTSFRFRPTESGPAGDPDPRDAALYARHAGGQLDADLLQAAFDRKEIVSRLPEAKLTKALTALYRKAKADLAEGGSNTLFLAVGMLKWKETAASDRVFRAPLILMPVTLDRRSANSRFTLKGHDDPTVFNLTLLEMLRRDFSLLLPQLEGELPHDDSGVDVEGVLGQVERAVRDIPGFEVVKEMVLSTFSFAKFLMWKDLEANLDAMRRSRLISHLIDTPQEAYAHSAQPMATGEIDRRIDPAALFLPMPADGSQVVAVHATAEGGDLVLEGPPGTGKSQTIANIIAHNLALGRSVLFVSEKRAALEVVYERLDKCGLGDFCLNLHSHKANKKAVLEQLGVAWRHAREDAGDHWERGADQLRQLKGTLNGVAEALHTPAATGITPQAAVGTVLQAHVDERPAIELDWGPDLGADPAGDRQGLADCREAVGELADAAAQLNATDRAAFAGIGFGDWSNRWQDETEKLLDQLAQACDGLQQAADQFVSESGLPFDRRDLAGLCQLAFFSRALTVADQAHLGFALGDDGDAQIATLKQLADVGDKFQGLRETLTVPVTDDAHNHPQLPAWSDSWRAAETAFFLLRGRKRKAIRTELLTLGRDGAALDPDHDLAVLLQMGELDRGTHAAAARLTPGHPWQGVGAPTKRLRQVLDLAPQIRSAIAHLVQRPDELVAMQRAAFVLLVEGRALLKPGSPLVERAKAFRHAFKRFEELQQQLDGLLIEKTDPAVTAAALAERCRVRRSAWPRVKNWCRWNVACATSAALRLESAADALDKGRLTPAEARDAFEVGYARWLAPKVLDADQYLRGFLPDQHQHRLDEFRQLHADRAAAAVDVIRHRLRDGVPDYNGTDRPGGYKMLHRELQKKSRHKPIRELLADGGDAVRRLTPCVLMSPLSVAQYVAADREPFDLVVFDEASQITVWDAIGALARGKNAIIVGDPKQMPPTSFFQKSPGADSDDGADDSVEDLESILDEGMAAGLRCHRLTGHYRSRHESLIAFSNHRYYDSELVTYPSTDTAASAVSLRVVDGRYQAGSGFGINVPEAQAVVDEVVRRLRAAAADPEGTPASIGIVTLNLKQQDLIENLLDEQRRADPSLETFFTDEADEPVFVKNLETVQGDQRDVIMISVGFGPTEPGSRTMSMNFGPLNKPGGERRLNVAITRATTEMVVFTSFDPGMIDLTRTKADGLRDLKHFLEFAERGPDAIAQAVRVEGGPDDFDSPFEASVAAMLRKHGWTVRTQVGVSKFRIDLGIVHPDFPGRFLAGVECDGATYHRSPSARDRDLVRQAVLEGLGWELLRVWSTDFFSDPDGRIEALHKELNELLRDAREKDARARQEAEAVAAERARAAAQAPNPPATDDHWELTPPCDSEATGIPDVVATATAAGADDEDVPLRDRFYEDDYADVLAAKVRGLIDRDGPILFDVLAREIAADHSLRAGAKIRERILSALGDHRTVTRIPDGGLICWPDGHAPAPQVPFRDEATYGKRRRWEEVPPPERRALIVEVLGNGLRGEPAAGRIAECMGYQRLRSITRDEIMAEVEQVAKTLGP